MPVSFLSPAQRDSYGQYLGDPSTQELARYFHLDDSDHTQIVEKRGDANRLGFALQLTTVRFAGRSETPLTAVANRTFRSIAPQTPSTRCAAWPAPAAAVKVEAIPWASGKHRLTDAYAWFLAGWTKRLSWQEVAAAFPTSWDTVYRAVRMAVEWGLAHRDLTNIEALGVDELSRRRGQRYLTLVYQIDSHRKRLLWVGRDRRAETLDGFFDWLGPARSAALYFVCSDMWKPLPDGGRRPGPAGGAGARPLPHHEPFLQGDRRGPRGRGPEAGYCGQGAGAQEQPLASPQASGASHRRAGGPAGGPRASQPADGSRLPAQGGLPIAVGLRVAVLGRPVPRPLVHSDDALAARPDEGGGPHAALAPRPDPELVPSPGAVLQWRCRGLQRQGQSDHQKGIRISHLSGDGSCSVSCTWRLAGSLNIPTDSADEADSLAGGCGRTGVDRPADRRHLVVPHQDGRERSPTLRARVFERALERKRRALPQALPPGLKRLDGEQEAQVIALRLGSPPEGYANWSLRLLARRVVELGVVESVSHETIPADAQKNEMPRRKIEYWVIPPQADAEFVAHMEQVLDLYQQPYDPAGPVVCMDEQPVQLVKGDAPAGGRHEDAPASRRLRARTGRHGLGVPVPASRWRAGARRRPEPGVRRRTGRWKSPGLLEGRYADCPRVTLACDNLNTHTKGAFYEVFEPLRTPAARRLGADQPPLNQRSA